MPNRLDATTRIARRLLTGIVLVTAAGCAGRGKPGYQLPDIPLIIHNTGYADVNVYVLPSTSDSRIRIGTVTGNSDGRFMIKRSLMRADGVLVLNLRAIASRYSWTTPSLVVAAGDAACLDIFSDPSGDLSRSSFYSVAVDEPETPGDSTPKPKRNQLSRISCRAG